MKSHSRKSFQKILIANRGEIAVRVLRACRELGIESVAVCSEADRNAMHAKLADEVVEIGPAPPLESYLRQDRILEAASQTGAQAVHPGYGFLAENAGFAAACADAGLVFIGPSPAVIEQMGEKTAARRIMEQAGVPVVPGALLPAPTADGELDAEKVLAAAESVGFPLMVKAAFGGGGKGMRLVTSPDDIVAATAAAAREALKAFGNGTVYLERYLERPRHVEFQIFGDSHGHAVHLGERECSIQRRHQKIIEETPSPVLTPELRERMGAAAVAAATAVGYENAGTVEFLLSQELEFYFLEMNTRLQVEHPVTELVTGFDLVRTQIAVAAGEPLPWRQEDIVPHGHAIECRLYAEDPAFDFRPSLGHILRLREPAGPGIRVDSGFGQGDEVSMYYDPMIAKLSVHGADRAAAIDRALDALRQYVVLGITTNTEYLLEILDHEAYRAGDTHTGFLSDHLPDWQPTGGHAEQVALAAAGLAEVLFTRAGALPHANGGPSSPPVDSPWERLGRFRLKGLV
ncbi:MAG: acetyl-CoA carboxylase biotin carboxylase subunit [bacterium]